MAGLVGNVFIHYLPSEFTKNDLEALCSPYGKIKSAKVMINLTTGTSKGFGFVRFETFDSAQKCINAINGIVLGKKKLLARFANSMENVGSPTNSIYVKSLPLMYEKKDIWDIFQKFGKILGIEIVINEKTHLRKGSAYITYSTQEEAMKAVEKMNNVVLEADSWPLFIRYTEKQVIESEPTKYGIHIEKPKKMIENSSQIQNTKSTAAECFSNHQDSKQAMPPPFFSVNLKKQSKDFKGPKPSLAKKEESDLQEKNDLYLQLLEDIDKEEEDI